ncbi:M23 family metallopeptidase [Helicobacter burdigaliensis]|uniref:M23 family metallopeptidase n=1 Tax=Helicobacter burdigaliensis TaxID=2315334 RepID=UPI000EF6E4C4|nr:M23 family metallopeptidase [Helicobacter burdigaliensis]
MKFLTFLLLISSIIFANSNIPKVANGTTHILITANKSPKPITFNKRQIQWISHPKDKNLKIALLGINYYQKPQIINLSNKESLEIVAGNYKKEQIQVSKEKAKPNKQNSQRIIKEREEALKIYNIYTKERFWNEPFSLPMESKITSSFGNARIFNGAIKSYHSGTDFRAKIGTPIKAINDGVVVIAKNRFLAGDSVVIDHGEGIYSMYYHCSALKVKVGDKIKQGDLIALSGNSGRVSGPHLHFGIMVNGVQVDPLNFIHKINALFN